MSNVYLTVGAPASGKSTEAQNMVKHSGGYLVLVCRDDIRAMHGFPPVGDKTQENLVTVVQQGIIETALLAGKDVIVADTNINKTFRKRLIKFCHEHGADVTLLPFVVPVDILVERDRKRERTVGEDVIRKMDQQLRQQLRDGDLSDTPQHLPVQRYEPYVNNYDSDRHDAYIFDIDGTVAKMNGRSPYDYSRVGEDLPMQDVLNTAIALDAMDNEIIFVSGRDDSCREATQEWLNKHFGDRYLLYMRKAGDQRPDWIVKNEIYDDHLIPHYNIIGVFDDRDQVVRHLRARGITVFQVNYGRF